jgi:phytoene/squalene synthetase
MSQGCSAPRDQEDDELTEEEEDGILAALAEVDAGKGIPLSHVIEMIEGGSRRS